MDGSLMRTQRDPVLFHRAGLPAMAVLAALTALAGCTATHAVLEELGDENDCRRTVVVGPPAERLEESEDPQAGLEALAVEWRLPPETVHVSRLNAWCAAVGPAVVGDWRDTAAAAVADTVWLVSWNVHVGGGDLQRLVEDLRSGALTRGRRVDHFVLLLQEAYREGDQVPDYDPAFPGGSGVEAAPPSGPREDIVAAAERLGLAVVYVPGMRNGEDEDRGNAILSTLPLRDPMAVELPVARQRRVAVAATVAGRATSGRDWRLQVTSTHLESSPTGWTSDEAQRLHQAETLVELLPDVDAAVAAGDFNTQSRGREEALVRTMLRAYPDTPSFPSGPTYRKAFGLYRGYLDYIFYRLPPETVGRYDRVGRAYASDHFPLVGWVGWTGPAVADR
jgi:endonuclease/exonuclease/phosphatase family metal-dependent hydrolase